MCRASNQGALGEIIWGQHGGLLSLTRSLARSRRYYNTDDGTRKLFTIFAFYLQQQQQQQQQTSHFRVIGTLPTAILFPPLLKQVQRCLV